MKPDQTHNHKVGRPSMLASENRAYAFRAGWITTPDGVVGFYEQSGNHPMTDLNFVARGRRYSSMWKRTFSDRYLKTLAVRFAREVTSEAGHDG